MVNSMLYSKKRVKMIELESNHNYSFNYKTFYKLHFERTPLWQDGALLAYYDSIEDCVICFTSYLADLKKENRLENLVSQLSGETKPISNISLEYHEPVEEHEDDDGYYYDGEDACIEIKYEACAIVKTRKEILGADGNYYNCLVENEEIQNKSCYIHISEEVFLFAKEA